MRSHNNKAFNIFLLVIMAAVTVALIFVLVSRNKADAYNATNNATFVPSEENIEIKIGENNLSDYSIYYNTGAKEAAKRLADLIEKETGSRPSVSKGKPSGKSIFVSVSDDSFNKIRIENSNITIVGNDGEDALHQVNVFANTYLGYAFAGDAREHILENVSYVNIPSDSTYIPDAWISKREPIICLWKTDAVRGIYTDQNTSLKSELLSYSDDMLYQYVKMMKHLGFTGIQVTDMCSAWARYGNYEFVHQRMRFMADAAHSLDMDFTLWVWGAEFDGYGWVDKDVKYIDHSHLSQEDEECIKTFDKYYSIYAKMADCSDRIIMHFNDPGNLYSSKDIGFFAKRFQNQCQSINPNVNFGVSCYTYQNNIEEMKEYLGKDVMLYTSAVHTEEETENYSLYSNWCAVQEFQRGVWSWNLAEMEIDQLAEMNVNAKIISDTYKLTYEAGEYVKPEYWSEMDSYHILNVFSLYCSGKMLQDPYLDPEMTLKSACVEMVGSEDADTLYEALSIIQDARSGNGWKDFIIKDSDSYILLRDDYPAEDLKKRCEDIIPKMTELSKKDIKANTIPMSIPVSEVMELIIPHLEQIKKYSEFRISLSKAEEMYKNGQEPEAIKQYLESIYRPVPTYNTVCGSWGQVEARAQYVLLDNFCEKVGIETPRNAEFDDYRKRRILGEMIAIQERYDDRLTFSKEKAYQFGAAYGSKETRRLVDQMVEEGILSEKDEDSVYLTDWNRDNIKYSFY